MSSKVKLMILAGVTILALNACTSSSTAPTASPSPSPVSETASPSPAPTAIAQDPVPQHGGQVVQMGNYHLELLAIPEGENMHVDFWLLKGSNYTSVGNAQVKATVQFPDGTQKTVEMTYDEPGKHYKAYIPGFSSGDYRVVVQTVHQGEQVNGRFNFKL